MGSSGSRSAPRQDAAGQPSTVQFELVPEELAPDENLDEELSMKKKASKEKQQVWNRSRSDHKQARTLLRANFAPGCYISRSGKKAIKVLHMLVKCYLPPGVDNMSYQYAGSSFPGADSYDTVCKWCAKAKDLRSHQDSSCTNTSSSSEGDNRVFRGTFRNQASS